MVAYDPDNYTLPNKKERSELCRSTGTSPFEPYTLWQASLNCASVSRPTTDSGTLWFQWQSPALVDHFCYQLHRLSDPKDRLPCIHHTGSIPASLCTTFCSRAPAAIHTRLFPVITCAKRLEFSRDSVTIWGLDAPRYLCLHWKNILFSLLLSWQSECRERQSSVTLALNKRPFQRTTCCSKYFFFCFFRAWTLLWRLPDSSSDQWVITTR